MFNKFRTWLIGVVAVLAAFFGWQYTEAAAGLTWTAPTTNTDGSPLTDLAGYRVYHRASATAGTFNFLAATAANVRSYTHAATVEGVNCYVVTAVDSTGNESDPSNQACKTIDTLRPNAPTGLTVN